MHLHSSRRRHVDPNFHGIVHPDPVLDDLCLQPCLAKLLRHVVGCRLVFTRPRDVGNFRQNPQVFFRQPHVGNRNELFLDLTLRSNIAESADRPVVGLCFHRFFSRLFTRLVKRFDVCRDQNRNHQSKEQDCARENSHGTPSTKKLIENCNVPP